MEERRHRSGGSCLDPKLSSRLLRSRPMGTMPASGPTRSLRSTCHDKARVVAVCRRHLLIAFGLRSLQPGISSHCGGGVRDRDGGYHQGPVWARLLGPFALAAYRVSGDATAAKAMLEAISNAMV